MKKFYLLAFGSILLLSATSQTTVNLQASRDNSIFQDYPNNSNALGENFFAGNTVIPSIRRGLIRFDIAAAIPAGATVNAVTLTLFCNLTIAGAVPVELHRATANWGEGTSNAGAVQDGKGVAATANDATWNCSMASGPTGCTTSWTTAGGDFDPVVSATTSVGSASGTVGYNWSSAQMRNDVQAWLNSPATNFGWLIMADETSIPSAKRFAARENSDAATRPVLSITYTAAVPVKLVFFRARENSNGILLNWETAQEFNNAFFSIEHSKDGAHFSAIGKVTGNGTSSVSNSYNFLHNNIEEGLHYYRLAQTDLDGSVHYSAIISVTTKNKYSGISISPNPVAGKLTILGSSLQAGSSYFISNQAGEIVIKGNLWQNRIDVQQLPAGIFYLRVLQKAGSLSAKFIKQ